MTIPEQDSDRQPQSPVSSTLPHLAVVQRCRHYMLWPETMAAETAPFQLAELRSTGLANANLKIGVRTTNNVADFSQTREEHHGDVFKYIDFSPNLDFEWET